MNILVLTSVFPRNDINLAQEASTKVVYYFCKQWMLQGHSVRVIHNAHRYPIAVYCMPKKAKAVFQAKKGFAIPDIKTIKKEGYFYDGIPVKRLPMFKLLPHEDHPKYVIRKQLDHIQNLLQNEDFRPDVIVGHWMSPQIQLISKLKDIYDCKTALVLHGPDYVDNPKFNFQQYLSKIDHLGCRSYPESERIKEMAKLNFNPFVCPSGIPEEYVIQKGKALSKFKNIKKWNIVFVGRLVEYKKIDKLILALSAIDNSVWNLEIVGFGAAEGELKKQVNELGLSDNVVFHGKKSREETQAILRRCHCFSMISSYEVFGLVYLEAMAAGCITIASKGSGVDGIIKDGINGYLCEPGNAENLTRIFKHILKMNENEIENIVRAGIETAAEYTDGKVAERYLQTISS